MDRGGEKERKTTPAIVLVALVLAWFALCGAGFWYIYSDLVVRSNDPAMSIAALQWMTWPFAVVALGGPLVIVVALGGSRAVRDLLEMRSLIVSLPGHIADMQKAVTAFQDLRAKLITDQSFVGLSAGGTTPTDATEEREAQEQPEHIKKFFELYDEAKKYLYRALEAYNARADEPLVIERGGANFGAVAAKLAEMPRTYDQNASRSHKIGEFVLQVVTEERNTRRWRLETLKAERVEDLARMKP